VVIPREQISLVSGLLDAFRIFFDQYRLGWIVPIVALFTVLGAFGELNAWAIAGVKGLFVTIEHGCLPPIFHKLNKRHVPVNLLIFQGVIVTVAAFIFLLLSNVNISYWILSALAAQMYLMMYIFLFIAGIVLRYRKPATPRPYRVPFKKGGMWIAIILGIGASLFALAVSFIPPFTFKIKSVFQYEMVLITGFVASVALPLIIFAFRKPHWKTKVLEEIREEIKRSTH
jgi:amino acid transporter